MSLKKSILLIAGIILLSYGNLLFNEFIGDTKSIYSHNTFYKNPVPLTKFFNRDFIYTTTHINPSLDGTSSSSGCISYRPVTAFTFLIDYQLFRGNPVWHHTMQLVYHFLATLLVFFFARRLLPNSAALFAALLFAVHPVQAEAVDNIGYRSDILVTIFSLSALMAFIRFREKTNGRPWHGYLWLAGSGLSCALALFSKESALVLPILILVYDKFFLNPSAGPLLRRTKVLLVTGAAAITIFYLFIYFVVFPSAHYPKFFAGTDAPLIRLATAIKIFSVYGQGLLWPFAVKILPPLYAPPVGPHDAPLLAITLVGILASIALAIKIFPRHRAVTFGIIWFYLTYLPASNIVSLPNPMAYRFLYLPMVGFVIPAAFAIEALASWFSRQSSSSTKGLIVKIIILAICVSTTIPVTGFFQNNLSACKEMVRNFPDSSRPYWNLGVVYYEMAKFPEAAMYFKEYASRATRNPFVPAVKDDALFHHALGRCYVNDPDEAVKEFSEAIRLKPQFLPAQVDMTKACLLKKNYPGALKHALVAIQLNDRAVIAYIYAAEASLGQNDFVAAQAFFKKAKAISPDDENVLWLENFLSRQVPTH